MNLGLKAKLGLGFVLVISVFSFLVIFGNFIAVKSLPEVAGPPSEANSSGGDSLQKIAQPTRYYNDIRSPNNNVASVELNAPKNLTGTVASELGQMIVQRNPDGPLNFDNKKTVKAPNLEASVASAFSSTVQNIDTSHYQPEIKKEDLKIVSNSPEAAVYYLTALRDALITNFKNLKINWNNDSEIIENIDSVLQNYDQSIKKLYLLPVPENLVKIHQKEISLVTAQKRIWESLSRHKEDPLRGIIAYEFFQSNNEEFAKLKAEIADFIQKNNIEIPSQ